MSPNVRSAFNCLKPRLVSLQRSKLIHGMIKSIDDYRKDILGIRLRGASLKPVIHKGPISFAFYADSNDFELQKPMINKILSLFKNKPPVFTDLSKASLAVNTLFIFGDLGTLNGIKAQESFSFQSFSAISQNPDLKRELWEKLKKYT